MAATILQPVVAANYAEGIEDVNLQAVDNTNNNYFVNDGSQILLVSNGSGGDLTITFPNIPESRYTLGETTATKTPATPIANGDVGFYGPFPVSIWPTQVEITWSTGTSVTAAVITMEANII